MVRSGRVAEPAGAAAEPTGDAFAAVTGPILGVAVAGRGVRGPWYGRPLVNFARYSRTHPHFRSERLPPLLAQVARPSVVADIGCGDGAVLYALHSRGLLGDRSYAIDASADRVGAAETAAPGVVGLVGDATHLPLEGGSVDGAICS